MPFSIVPACCALSPAQGKGSGAESESSPLASQWDEAKYPARRPLKETVEAITEIVTQLEDQLKVRLGLGWSTLHESANIFSRQRLRPYQGISTLVCIACKREGQG